MLPAFASKLLRPMAATPQLRRQLGFAAVAAIVAGDMLGSGIFFTPGELAPIAQADWQVYFFWALCGAITLCGALTLGELSSLIPRSGATLHIIGEGFGPFWAFLKAWMEVWVSGPGSVAGVAIVFGEFVMLFLGAEAVWSAPVWGVLAILLFAAINLLGVRWGGRTQVVLTGAKILGVLGLVVGGIFLAEPVARDLAPAGQIPSGGGLLGFVRLVGLGVAAVLFTYDGWSDISHVAEEVEAPRRTLPRGLALGVGGITVLYLVVNYAFLRVVPLDRMRESPTTIAAAVADAAFGESGGALLNTLIMVSIFGGLGGLVMSLPRFYYATGQQYGPRAPTAWLRSAFGALTRVTPRTAAPIGAIIACSCISIVALLSFGSFARIVNFFVVPMHVSNILMVASVFRLRARSLEHPEQYLTPGYPYLPLVYMVVIGFFLVSAILYRPLDTLIGVALTATGVPVYWMLERKDHGMATE
jgi:APA family basic amino acid/polyamine antiporter